MHAIEFKDLTPGTRLQLWTQRGNELTFAVEAAQVFPNPHLDVLLLHILGNHHFTLNTQAKLFLSDLGDIEGVELSAVAIAHCAEEKLSSITKGCTAHLVQTDCEVIFQIAAFSKV
jgi:hypothetical protein